MRYTIETDDTDDALVLLGIAEILKSNLEGNDYPNFEIMGMAFYRVLLALMERNGNRFSDIVESGCLILPEEFLRWGKILKVYNEFGKEIAAAIDKELDKYQDGVIKVGFS